MRHSKWARLAAIAVALTAFAALSGLAFARIPSHVRPALELDLTRSVTITPSSGLIALKNAVLQGFKTPVPATNADGGKLDAALGRQIAELRSMGNDSAILGRGALDRQLGAIRNGLEEEAARQLEAYRETVRTENENARRKTELAQKESLDEYQHLIEAQYAQTLLNLQLQMQAAPLSGRPELQRRIDLITEDIARQVADRARKDLENLKRLDADQAEHGRMLIEAKGRELSDWVEREFRRIKSELEAEFSQQNGIQASSFQSAVERRKGELTGESGNR